MGGSGTGASSSGSLPATASEERPAKLPLDQPTIATQG